ncbi:hypothetical protein V2J09_007356, partial [Rumex salicifolius]
KRRSKRVLRFLRPPAKFVTESIHHRRAARIITFELSDDEELVDQKKYLEDLCQSKCVKPLLAYQACVKRIQDDKTGHKHCTGQYFDYWSCVDKCVAPKLLAKLK